MDILSLLLQLVCGAFGGNVAGAMLPSLNLGPRGNALAGLVGGGLGGSVLAAIMAPAANVGPLNPDITLMLGQMVGAGLGGALVSSVVGILQRALRRT